MSIIKQIQTSNQFGLPINQPGNKHQNRQSTGFTSASMLDTSFLNVPASLHTHIAGVIDHFESGTITLLESDDVSTIHEELHVLMANSIELGLKVKLIDIANCFNPHLISTITFNSKIDSHQVLQNISLARPFQLHQSVSIIKQLAKEVTEKHQSTTPQLIIITNISAQFFDFALASEDKNFPIPQLELLRHVLGILKGLATQGHTIVITDQTKQKNHPVEVKPAHLINRVQTGCLSYTSNVHIRIETSEKERKIYLLNHPFLPENQKSVKLSKHKTKKIDSKQTSLDNWY